MAVRVLLEGRPGSGKTTVAERLAKLLTDRGVEVRGFTTREMRKDGRRVGFRVEAIGGERATLAHESFEGKLRVGRYGVDVEAFESIALPTLERPPRSSVVVIDELGKMELASERFRQAVSMLFESPVDLVATAHAFRHAFTDRLKSRGDVERIAVTRANRDALAEQLAARLSAGSRG